MLGSAPALPGVSGMLAVQPSCQRLILQGGGGAPEGGSWAPARDHQVWLSTRLSRWLRTVLKTAECFLAQGADSPEHEEVGIVLCQPPYLLGLVCWVKMCGLHILALISPFISSPQPPEDLCVGGDGASLRVRKTVLVGRERWGTWGPLRTGGRGHIVSGMHQLIIKCYVSMRVPWQATGRRS